MSNNIYTALSHDHGDEQFKPNTTVAAIVHCKGKFLFVEELENNKHVFNQPAGHVEANENLVSACMREVLEETGLALSPDYVSGMYYFYRPEFNLTFLRFCFVIEVDELFKTTPQDDEILACHWFDLNEIKARKAQLRSTMVFTCIEDYLAINNEANPDKVKIPLNAFASNMP